jgi:hypothetical protein
MVARLTVSEIASMYRTRLASGRSLRRRKSTEERMIVSRLLKSCATPPVNWPIASSLGLSTRRLAFQQRHLRLPQRFRLNNSIDSGAQEIHVPTQKA